MAYAATQEIALTGLATAYFTLDPAAEDHAISLDDATNVTSVAVTSSSGTIGASSVWSVVDISDETDLSNVAAFQVLGGFTGMRIIHTGAVNGAIQSRFV